MRRYVFPVAFGLCVAGLGLALYFGAGLSAFLFVLGATCFAVRALGDMRQPKPGPAAAMFGNPSDWLNREFMLAMDEKFILLPPGAHIESNLPALRKREAFRRYREYWAGVGQ